MKTFKILVVEKDLLARQAISRMLKKKPEFNVKASSLRGINFDTFLQDCNPDVVLFNLEDLESEDFEIFTKLRVRYPKLPVVVLSPRTKDGAKAAVTAISMGAVDVVTKPGNCNNLLFANRHLSKRLIPIVEVAAAWGDKSAKAGVDSSPAGTVSLSSMREKQGEEHEAAERREAGIITIGACCGGPKSLMRLIEELPPNLSVPVVVVQHFPKLYTKVLAEELDKRSRLKVREVIDGAELSPGIVWIARGGYHTEIHHNGSNTQLRIHRGPRELGDRPSINVLFRSAVRAFGDKTLGIVLSGIGQDGVAGAEAIRMAGGEVLVQEPRTSLAPEMPSNIIKAGYSDQCYSLDEFNSEIMKRIPKPVETSYSQSIQPSKKFLKLIPPIISI